MLIFIVLACTLSPFLYAMFMPHGSMTFCLVLNKNFNLRFMIRHYILSGLHNQSMNQPRIQADSMSLVTLCDIKYKRIYTADEVYEREKLKCEKTV